MQGQINKSIKSLTRVIIPLVRGPLMTIPDKIKSTTTNHLLD
jgi:hypothetical protein